MTHILKKDEVDETRVTMGHEDGEEAAGNRKPAMQRYDFKHPARFSKAQLRTLENLHDNFARLTSSTWSSMFGVAVDCETAFVDQTTYREFIESRSNPSCSYQFSLNPTGGQAILDFDMSLLFGFTDRRTGGKGSSEGVDARQMSQIEMGLFAKIVKALIVDIEATWEPLERLEISQIELETNPEFMQIELPSEIVILMAFEISSTHMKGHMSLCYPFFTLQPLIPMLDYWAGRRSGNEELALANRLRLGGMPLEAKAELGRAHLSVAEANSLQVGDVICSDRSSSEPIPVFIGGKARHLAYPYASNDGKGMLKIAGDIE